MNTVTLDTAALNKALEKLANLPYREVADIFASVHQSIESNLPKNVAPIATKDKDAG